MAKKIFVFILLFSLSVFSKKILDLPRYQPVTRVDDEVVNFLNNQDSLSKKSVSWGKKNKTNRDILGRLTKDTSLYILRPELLEKRIPVGIIDLTPRNKQDGDAIEFYRNKNGDKFIRLNGKEISFEEYRKVVQVNDEQNEKVWKRKPFIRYENLTAQEIKDLISNPNNPVYVFFAKKLSIQHDDSFYHYSLIFGYSGVNGIHSVGVKGNGVGLFFEESYCPDYTELDLNYFDQSGNCQYTGLHATKVAKLLQLTAPEAMVVSFVGDSAVIPVVENYANQYNPKLEIGSYSWHYINTPWEDSVYSYTDQNLDQHIYEDRLIYFVAAGNMAGNNDVYVGSPGKALNAITVGAVLPHTGEYANDSKWKNSELRNQKPEIANYTNFDFGPSLNHMTGTSASTPYSAAIAALVLSADSNLKRHPEVIKSMYLMNAIIPISGTTHDEDDLYSISSSLPYFDVNGAVLIRWWSGVNSAFFDSNEKIIFTETDVVSGAHCRAAISWLTSGSYAGVYKSLAQDLDLFVYQGSTEPIGSSQSIYNPFEVVSFTTQSNADLRFEIKRFANSQSDDIALGFTLRCDL